MLEINYNLFTLDYVLCYTFNDRVSINMVGRRSFVVKIRGNMKKVIFNSFIIIYTVFAVFITVCLLSYNDYNVTEFGKNSLIIVKDKKSNYNKNDLLIVKRDKKYKKDINVFYYLEKNNMYYIKYGNIDKIGNNNLTVDGKLVSRKMILSIDKNVVVIPYVGGVLAVLESRWGYLCFIILPILIAFIYELFEIIKELKKNK